MTARHYILRSLAHHRFAYLGVFLGAVLGATVLLGALFAGDSVKASLRRIAELRIGRATHILTSGDRFFREALADDLAKSANIHAAPVLYARGAATHAGTQTFANQVQLVGITDAFWQFAPTPHSLSLPTPTSVAINTTLAHRLALAVNDTLIIRVQKPGILSGNAPVAGAETKLQSLRCTVAAIVDDAQFGRFTLETTQVAQPSIFLPIATLQETFARDQRANLLLLSGTPNPEQLRASLQLPDYGLKLRHLPAPANTFELTSDRLFLDPTQLAALTAVAPDAQPVLSYLVNDLRIQDRSTPYSVAAATTPAAAPFLPANLGPRDIVLNSWLAEDLQARPGDEVRVAYFQVGPRDNLVEQTAAFRVHSIVPLENLAADSAWMPEFPGITDVHDQSKWDPGLPLDLKRIRDKDERYWDDYRGAPKAWFSLEAGRTLWSTRWGNSTALRIPAPAGVPPSQISNLQSQITASLLASLRPEMNQLQLRDLRSTAAASAASPVDFAGLFLGMSFFLILAALGLVAMLFQFVLLQRNQEDALLAAVGVSPKKLLRWRLLEGVALLTLAALVAVPLAMLYTRGILHFLETIWAAQATTSTFLFHAAPASIATGLLVFLLLSLAAIWLAIRQLSRRTLSIRLAAKTEDTTPLPRVRRSSLLLLLSALAATILSLGFANRGLPAQIAFYLAGFTLLAAGLAAFRWWLALPRASRLPPHASPSAIAVLNLKSRRARSLTVVGLIATAVFMVLSVASFRKHVGSDWLERTSGTGGFPLWIETTAPQNLARDRVGPSAFDFLAPHAAALGDVLPFRAGAGDNANCFNLNTTAQPQLLAVDTARILAPGAFGTAPGAWSLLSLSPHTSHPTPHTSLPPDTLPALVDQNTLLWALKRKVGDILTYTDEAGRTFRIQIVGTMRDSIFQGYLLVDEKLFLQKFPSHPGYSIFLASSAPQTSHPTPHTSLSALRTRLEASARDVGGRVELTRDILAAFHQIENTYIAIFNVLGSLGVILGSLGLAIVVARNLRERRGEFAVLSAIGIPRAILACMVFAEFSRLVFWGLAIGTLASLVAILPNLTALPPASTLALVAALLLGIVALNLLSGITVFRRALRDLHPSAAIAAS